MGEAKAPLLMPRVWSVRRLDIPWMETAVTCNLIVLLVALRPDLIVCFSLLERN